MIVKYTVSIKNIFAEDYINKVTEENILNLANIYILKKQWLICILMLEEYLENNSPTIESYNCISFCYLSTKLYNISEYYYKKALNLDPSNIICLKNLANIYSTNYMNDKIKQEIIHKQIKQQL